MPRVVLTESQRDKEAVESLIKKHAGDKNASFTIEEAQKIWEKYFPEMELKYLFAKDEKKVG